MSLWTRLRALERDVEQARRDMNLLPHWRTELAQTRTAIAAAEAASHVHPRKGCDYAWGRPSVGALHAHGVSFAMRYLTGAGKALDRTEAKRLSEGGIAIGSIFEEGAMNVLSGRTGGKQDALAAMQAAERVGMPHGRPIFFACDFDINTNQLSDAVAYLVQAHATMAGRYLVGIYGGRRMVEAARNAGFHFLWQTLAWSGGAWVPQAQVRQTAVSGMTLAPNIDGVSVDANYAYAHDFGQWKV